MITAVMAFSTIGVIVLGSISVRWVYTARRERSSKTTDDLQEYFEDDDNHPPLS